MDSFRTSGVEGGADVGDESPRHCRRFRPGRPLEVADQGAADEFLVGQLKPELLQAACEAVGHPLELRLQPGYDHSYYFIESFIGEHIAYHAQALKAQPKV